MLTLAQDTQVDHMIENRQTTQARRLRIPFLYLQCQRTKGVAPKPKSLTIPETSVPAAAPHSVVRSATGGALYDPPQQTVKHLFAKK